MFGSYQERKAQERRTNNSHARPAYKTAAVQMPLWQLNEEPEGNEIREI